MQPLTSATAWCWQSLHRFLWPTSVWRTHPPWPVSPLTSITFFFLLWTYIYCSFMLLNNSHVRKTACLLHKGTSVLIYPCYLCIHPQRHLLFNSLMLWFHFCRWRTCNHAILNALQIGALGSQHVPKHWTMFQISCVFVFFLKTLKTWSWKRMEIGCRASTEVSLCEINIYDCHRASSNTRLDLWHSRTGSLSTAIQIRRDKDIRDVVWTCGRPLMDANENI